MKNKIVVYKGDFNSSINQRIKEKFVNQHVICGLNQTISKLNELDDNNGYYTELYDAFSNYEPVDENYNVDYDNGYYPEIFEYWNVSSYLADKLEENGECIAKDFLDFNIWGRCTTGQHILLDSVISHICADMEILEGQKYQWEV